MIYVLITMFRVYMAVRTIEVTAEKYNFRATRWGLNKKKSRKRSRRIMIQGVLYSMAMALTWIFIFIHVVVYWTTNSTNFVFMVIILNPMQGLFNFFIYLLPVFRKMLKARSQRKLLLVSSASTRTSTESSCRTNFSEQNMILPCKENSNMNISRPTFPVERLKGNEGGESGEGGEHEKEQINENNHHGRNISKNNRRVSFIDINIEEEKEEEKKEAFDQELQEYIEDEELMNICTEDQNNQDDSYDSDSDHDDNGDDYY